MSPYTSSYFDCVHCEDVDLLTDLAVTVLPFTFTFLKYRKDIRRKMMTSTSWCHLAARAVASVFEDKGLTVVDGRVYDIVLEEHEAVLIHTTHSWCLTKHGAVLDVAPIGIVSYMPLLFAQTSGVKNTSYGYVTNRYQPTSEVDTEVRNHLRSQKFRDAFPVYVSALRQARHVADKKLTELKGV